uniref:Uncharacterized protein n=1 Tax=Anopheles funestus TaxID=62324 RepID=A0A182RTM5_ANOFN
MEDSAMKRYGTRSANAPALSVRPFGAIKEEFLDENNMLDHTIEPIIEDFQETSSSDCSSKDPLQDDIEVGKTSITFQETLFTIDDFKTEPIDAIEENEENDSVFEPSPKKRKRDDQIEPRSNSGGLQQAHQSALFARHVVPASKTAVQQPSTSGFQDAEQCTPLPEPPQPFSKIAEHRDPARVSSTVSSSNNDIFEEILLQTKRNQEEIEQLKALVKSQFKIIIKLLEKQTAKNDNVKVIIAHKHSERGNTQLIVAPDTNQDEQRDNTPVTVAINKKQDEKIDNTHAIILCSAQELQQCSATLQNTNEMMQNLTFNFDIIKTSEQLSSFEERLGSDAQFFTAISTWLREQIHRKDARNRMHDAIDLERRKTTTKRQFDRMVTIFEENKNLEMANGRKYGGDKFWKFVASELNVLGPPIKDGTGWKKVNYFT